MLIKLYYIVILLYVLCFLFCPMNAVKDEYALGIAALIANGTALV